jgi:tetratricopeptide (TPR) repeat protein
MAEDQTVDPRLLEMDGQEFTRRLRERQEGTGYAFLLGAGCSVSSGIPSAGTLVKEHWLPRLHRFKGGDGEVEAWAVASIDGYDPGNPGLSYGRVMKAAFASSHDKQREVERICRGRDPGFGCCVLAKLIEAAGADFNVVLTTNFDDLIADALYLFTDSRPLVISHGTLAPFMLADPRRPLVAKLHGDHQLEPLNTEEEVAALNEKIDERMRRLLQQRGLIVMGYAGNDDSVMGALEALPSDALGPGAWWVSRRPPNERVTKWLVDRSGYWVRATDFDQLMLLMRDEFELGHPDLARWKTLHDNYMESLARLSSDVRDMSTSEPAADALKRASDSAIDNVSDWWAVELAARRHVRDDPDRAEQIYLDGLQQLPGSAELRSSYAVFLWNTREATERAAQQLEVALELDPNDAPTIRNYALLLADSLQEFDRAEELFRRSLEIDPDSAVGLANYASLLTKRKRFDHAEELYKRSIELRPDHSATLNNYANLLVAYRRDFDRAEALLSHASELDPSDPNVIGNRARMLLWRGDDADAMRLIDEAFDLAPLLPALELELWFYLYANGPVERRDEALRNLKRLIGDGAATPGWEFSGNVERAKDAQHPGAAWLGRLATVVDGTSDSEVLAPWDAWQAA